VDRSIRDRCDEWDPYVVWQILLHRHPVRVADASTSVGRIEPELLREFCEAISDYPDFLQDALLLIAHAEGVPAAAEALDKALREDHASCLAQLQQPPRPAPPD
jgi:hypothetical protein